MRGAPDIGLIKNRDEVEPHGEGYRGVIVIAGQGRWQTPEAPSREAAVILLNDLRATLQPRSQTGLSPVTSVAMTDALAKLA